MYITITITITITMFTPRDSVALQVARAVQSGTPK
jgi:hypothetical protein